MEYLRPLVCDNGSGTIKAGFAGEEAPNFSFPSLVGWGQYPHQQDSFVGFEAQERSNILTLKYPIERGIITNWGEMLKIWEYTFYQKLHMVRDAPPPVLLTEVPHNPREKRQRMAEIMYETFNVPALCITSQALPALYGSGRTTGIVVESGDGVSHIVPIQEGKAVKSASTTLNFAGRDLTNALKQLLEYRGFSFRTFQERLILKGLKERLGYIAFDYEKENIGDERHVLPDGRTITIGPERFQCGEVLFRPALGNLVGGSPPIGIHEATNGCILGCEAAVRKELYKNVVLSGGSTMFPGMAERMQKEIALIAPMSMKAHAMNTDPGKARDCPWKWDFVNVVTPPNRGSNVWIGGSVLASLSTFLEKWCVTKESYEEAGFPEG